MKVANSIFSLDNLSQPPGRIGAKVLRGLRLLGLFAVSLAITFLFFYVVFKRIGPDSFAPADMLHGDIFWPLMALGVAITLANFTVIEQVKRRFRKPSPTPEPSLEQSPTASQSVEENDMTHQVLHLKRSAERLDNVERDLIRKISDSFPVDLATQKLLAEMRVCTNRLRGQLSYLKRDNGAEGWRQREDHDRPRQKPGLPEPLEFRYGTPPRRRRSTQSQP